MTLARRFAQSRRIPFALAAVLGLGGLAWGGNLGYHALVDPAILIENASGRDLWGVEIHWHHWNDGPVSNELKQWVTLRPGETRRVSLSHTLYPTAFTAVLDGRRVLEDLAGFYVGSGETLLVRILPGGRVVRGYPHMVDRAAQ